MKSLFVLGTVAMAACVALPADAATRSHQRHQHSLGATYNAEAVLLSTRSTYGFANGGFMTGPYRQGTPMDTLPIWRKGYYQGNDPDQNIRLQLIRDGRNYTH